MLCKDVQSDSPCSVTEPKPHQSREEQCKNCNAALRGETNSDLILLIAILVQQNPHLHLHQDRGPIERCWDPVSVDTN